MHDFAPILRTALQSEPEAIRHVGLKRSASVFSQGQPAEAAYLIESGLVKLTRADANGEKIILALNGKDQFIGEEALLNKPVYYSEAEVLSTATIYQVPREVLRKVVAANSELALQMADSIIRGKLAYARKIELLCLHDVEYRILQCLLSLSEMVPQGDDGAYAVPITQLELADLIGATRETTSTTLNQFERQGIVRLARRLLIISSQDNLRTATNAKLAMGAANGR